MREPVGRQFLSCTQNRTFYNILKYLMRNAPKKKIYYTLQHLFITKLKINHSQPGVLTFFILVRSTFHTNICRYVLLFQFQFEYHKILYFSRQFNFYKILEEVFKYIKNNIVNFPQRMENCSSDLIHQQIASYNLNSVIGDRWLRDKELRDLHFMNIKE